MYYINEINLLLVKIAIYLFNSYMIFFIHLRTYTKASFRTQKVKELAALILL